MPTGTVVTARNQVQALARLLLAATLVVVLSVAASATAQDPSLQERIDTAERGGVVTVEPGTYEQRLRIDRPLTLEGQGEVAIDGGDGPAVEVTSGDVSLVNLTLRSATAPVRIRDAGSVRLWNVTADSPHPLEVRDTRWLSSFRDVDRKPLEVDARNATVVRGHPARVTLRTQDGAAYPGASVTVRDGERIVLEGTSGPDGRLEGVPVADSWTHWGPDGYRVDDGTNRTSVVVLGWQAEASVGPGVEELDLTVVTASESGGEGPPTWAWILGLGSATLAGSLAAAFRYHEGFRWWWLSTFAPLYTRLARSELLDHETRAEIYHHLEEEPGTHLRQLKRELDLKHGTLLHHLKMLEDQEMIRSVKDGMYRRFYLIEDAPTEGGAPSTRERVERAILSEPGTTNQAIADELDEQASTIHYHVDQLVEDERIEKERDGRKVRLYPSEEWVPAQVA